MPKFFVSPQDVQGDSILIREESHHILHVLRLGPGDGLLVCDGQGTDYHCVIEGEEGQGLVCRIRTREPSAVEPQLQVTLFQGLPKAEKMEWIIQKNTELGIAGIVPVMTRRSIVRLDAKKEKSKTERWNKIALAAAKQSGRGRIPAVAEVMSLEEAIGELRRYDRAVVLYEDEKRQSLKQVLSGWEKPASLALLIGPEGGWEPEEIERLKAAGTVPAGLGPRILRTETAGQTATALALYHYDEM